MNMQYGKMIALAAACVLAAGGAQGQNRLSGEVEVTRDYEPAVVNARKLTVRPSMTDTVSLRPSIDYSIRSTVWNTEFETQPFAAAALSTAVYRRERPFYLKAGAGMPLQSEADLYLSTVGGKRGAAGLYLNHAGSYAKIKDDADIKRNALTMENVLGAFGRRRFAAGALRDIVLEAELTGENRMYDRYGAADYRMETLPDIASVRECYNSVTGRGILGNDFSDLSFFNIQLGGEGSYFHGKGGYKQAEVDVYLKMGKNFGRHRVTLQGGYASRWAGGGGPFARYYDDHVKISPRYSLLGGKIRLTVGLDADLQKSDFVYYGHPGDKDTWLFPYADIVFGAVDRAFIPFVRIDGGLSDGSYAALSRINPYVERGLVAPDRAEYNLRGGVMGSTSTAFHYTLYAGVSHWENNAFLTTVYYMPYGNGLSTFGVLLDDCMVFTVCGNIEARPAPSVELNAAVQWHSYEAKNLSDASGLPALEASLAVRFRVGERLSFKVGGELTGPRKFLETEGILGLPTVLNADVQEGYLDYWTNKVSTVVNVTLDAEYRLNDKMMVYLSGRNLAGCKLYPYNHYRGYGVNALAGIKLVF